MRSLLPSGALLQRLSTFAAKGFCALFEQHTAMVQSVETVHEVRACNYMSFPLYCAGSGSANVLAVALLPGESSGS